MPFGPSAQWLPVEEHTCLADEFISGNATSTATLRSSRKCIRKVYDDLGRRAETMTGAHSPACQASVFTVGYDRAGGR